MLGFCSKADTRVWYIYVFAVLFNRVTNAPHPDKLAHYNSILIAVLNKIKCRNSVFSGAIKAFTVLKSVWSSYPYNNLVVIVKSAFELFNSSEK
jgi:hypothetical protein